MSKTLFNRYSGKARPAQCRRRRGRPPRFHDHRRGPWTSSLSLVVSGEEPDRNVGIESDHARRLRESAASAIPTSIAETSIGGCLFRWASPDRLPVIPFFPAIFGKLQEIFLPGEDRAVQSGIRPDSPSRKPLLFSCRSGTGSGPGDRLA